MNLNKDQALSYNALLDPRKNIFLTGPAGTGKSFLTKSFIDTMKNKGDFAVLSSTGVSALIIGGTTMHRWFGFGTANNTAAAVVAATAKTAVQKRIMSTRCILIDEISMVSDELFNAAEKTCRMVRASNEPWGGIKVVAVGDFRQLPPVITGDSKATYAFKADAWAKTGFINCVLRTPVRQQDTDFIEILRHVRGGVCTPKVRDFLNSKTIGYGMTKEFEGTRIYARRASVLEENLKRLHQLPGKLWTLPTDYTGDERGVESLKKNGMLPETLYIKEGALIMILKNHSEGLYANGTLAHVLRISEDMLTVKLLSNGSLQMFPRFSEEPFAANDADGIPIAFAQNFPVTLAYATTIHKSQGATIDKALIDLRNLWEYGQAYVALSRVKSPEGLHLVGWDEKSIKADPVVTEFYKEVLNDC